MVGAVGLIKLQSSFSLPISQAQIKVSKNSLYPNLQGSWRGNLQGTDAQDPILLYIDSAGKLHGSYESNRGAFLDISGYHRGNKLYMTFHPAAMPSTHNDSSVVATAQWKGVNRFYLYGQVPVTGGSATYMFERPPEYLPEQKSSSKE